MKTKILEDGKGNLYVEHGKLRLTLIRRKGINDEKDWSDKKFYLRIQAYDTETRLRMRSEVPLDSRKDLDDICAKIKRLYFAGVQTKSLSHIERPRHNEP